MSLSDSQSPQRNNNSKRDGASVDDEVQKLFRKSNGKMAPADFMKLRSKYDDVELAEKIQKTFLEKHAHITKKAKKFAQLIREKYSNRQYPFHILLEKARLFKNKHDLSEDEFAEFQRIYEQELVGLQSPDISLPATNMMKVLGGVSVEMSTFTTKLNDQDYKHLQEILRLNASSKALHAQVVLQSMQYRDCDFEAVTGKYDRTRGDRPQEHVHPVVAAMFLPKVEHLENTFLHANISTIVKSRYNGEALVTRPDYDLFYSLINDPNDVVCDNRSSVLDLLNRCQVQQQLWQSVLSLRNGRYYEASLRDFIGAIDMCKLNKQDNPDLVYGRYDGTVLKRLLSAFSFRPTVVSVMPVYNVVSLNPYQQNVRPVVSAVPMINLRLPPSINDNDPIALNEALEQHQYFIENGVMVPRHTSLIYSKGVLFFYVDRRSNIIRFNNEAQPFNIARLPLSVSGFERLNDRQVDFDCEIKIRDDIYQLRSVVLAVVNNKLAERNMVVGSSTLVMTHPSEEYQTYVKEAIHYDPLSVIDGVAVPAGQGLNGRTGSRLAHRDPVSQICVMPTLGDEGNSFFEMAKARGIIFMYQLVRDRTDGELRY
jgi:hypothetical protein